MINSLLVTTLFDERSQGTRTERVRQAVGRALRRAAKAARKTAQMHGTPIAVWENGKVVAKQP